MWHRSPNTLPSIRGLAPRLQTPKQVPVPTQVRVGGFSPVSQQGVTMGGCKHWSQMYPSPIIPGSKSSNQHLCDLCSVFHWEHENPRVQECRNVKCYQSPAAHKEQRRPINATICVIPEWASLQHTKTETSNKCNYLCCISHPLRFLHRKQKIKQQRIKAQQKMCAAAQWLES